MEDLVGQSDLGTAFLPTGVSTETRDIGMVQASLKQLYMALEAPSLPDFVTGALASPPVACAGGGTISVSTTTAVSDRISNGDSMSITANNCTMEGGTFNGKIDYKFADLFGTIGSATAWRATLTLKFTGFSLRSGSSTFSANGDMTIVVNQTNSTNIVTSIRGESLEMKVTESGTTTVNQKLTKYDVKASEQSSSSSLEADYTISGSSAKLGTTHFTVDTLTPFVSTNSIYPSTGTAKITALDRSSATFTALNSTNVKIELDRNGDGTTDETINTTWAEIENSI
jgi:hypothetical protein